MKASARLLFAVAVGAAAQGTGLQPCAETCFNNMLAKAQELGCGAGDATCLCANPNFTYGIRDCSYAACGNSDWASAGVAYGVTYCQNAGVAITTNVQNPDTPASASGGAGGAGGNGGNGGGAGGAATALTTYTSDGTVYTATVTGSLATGAATAGGPVVTTITENGTTRVTTIDGAGAGAATGTTTGAGSRGTTSAAGGGGGQSGGAGSGSGSASSTSSSGFAQKTAAPAGLLAAAGLAAMLL